MAFNPHLKELAKGYWLIKRRLWLKWLIIIFLFMATAIAGSGIASYLTFYYYTGYIPLIGDLNDDHGNLLDLDKLSREDFLKSSLVRAKNGEIIGRYFYENRDLTQTNEVPVLLKNAFIATEDKRFNHNRPNHLKIDYLCDPIYGGVDPCAIVRAGIGHYMFRFRTQSGASTIGQQVARQIYAEEVMAFKKRDQTFRRKIKEARVAIQMVRRYPPDMILLNLLNRSWFGHGVNGIREACRYYFNKECAGLSLREAVILASMNKSAAIYCPIFHEPRKLEDKTDENTTKKYQTAMDQEAARIAKTRARYNSVLSRMLEDGYISQEEFKQALFKKDEPRKLEFLDIRPLKNPEFGYVNRLVKEFMLGNGLTDNQITRNSGFRIQTTLDSKIQKVTVEEFEKHLELINDNLDSSDQLNGAFIVIEIKTGNIVALSGGYNYNQSQFNRVLAYRSPGSGYKPFVYAAALENGYDLFSKFCNIPFTMRGANNKTWSPQNFQDKNPRPTDCNRYLGEGPIFSLNLETLDIARRITMNPIVELSNRLGIWGNPGIVRDSHGDIWFRRPHYNIKGGLVPLLPTAIGASDVNLLELANAYAVFFRGGIYKKPTLIQELADYNGNKVMKIEPSYEERVISKETADKVLAMMRAVTKIGTAKISMRGIEQQVACKTGTSDGPRDVSIWCGTPEYVIGIRFGRDDYDVIDIPEYMKMASGDSSMQVSGGWVVGKLMRNIIDKIYADRGKVSFNEDVEMYTQLLLDTIK